MRTSRYPARSLTAVAFNMVEIVLAMVVVLIGVIGVVAVLPAAGKTSSSALNKNASADAADQFLRYYASKMKLNWGVANALPIGKPGTDETAVKWQVADSAGILSAISGVSLYYNDKNGNGAFDVAPGVNRDDSGFFRLVQRTGTNLTDFDGVMRVWRSPTTYNTYDTASNTWILKPVPPDNGSTVNVEVSYPTALPYAQREKQVFSLDVFRPVALAASSELGAFSIPVAGTLKFVYNGSSAGYASTTDFWLIAPDGSTTKVFTANAAANSVFTYPVTWGAGSTFNCYIEVNQSLCGLSAPYRHYAWAQASDAYYKDSATSNSGAYSYQTGRAYAMVVPVVVGSQWAINFEDMAGCNGPDYDYNDVVLTAQLIPAAGEASSQTAAISATTLATNAGSGGQIDLVLGTNGALMSYEGGLSAYSGTALAVWLRPGGSGTQTILVNGASTTINNCDLTAFTDLTGNMTVALAKSGSTWTISVTSTSAIFTTMK